MTLPARASHVTNLVVARLYVPVTVVNAAGGQYRYFYGLGLGIVLVLLGVVLRHAWSWPRTAPSTTGLDHDDARAPQHA